MTTAASYLLPDINVEQCLQLTGQGVNFRVWGSGIVLCHEDLNKALDALQMTGEVGQPEFEGLYPVVLKPKPRKAPHQPITPAQDDNPQRAEYIRLCSSRMQEVIDAANQKLKLRLSQLAPARAELFALRRYEFAQVLAACQSRPRELFNQQFEQLTQVEKVAAVRVSRDCVLVYTEMLTAIHPATRKEHAIGKFIIVVDLNAAAVRWFNQSRTAIVDEKTWHAPNVDADGCAGVAEVDESFLQLVANFELAVVAELAIQFVETVESSEAARRLAVWPCLAAR